MYCDLIETLSDKCGEYSLLEIWKYDEARIRALSIQDIIDAVNTVDESPVFGYDTDFTDYLGGIKRCARNARNARTMAIYYSYVLLARPSDNLKWRHCWRINCLQQCSIILWYLWMNN